MARYSEQFKIDFSGELPETRFRAVDIFVKQLISDDVLLEKYVKRAYEVLKEAQGVLLPHSIGEEMISLFWGDRGWSREQLDSKLLEKNAEKLFAKVLKKMAEISRREKEERIGFRSSQPPEEPEHLTQEINEIGEYHDGRRKNKKRTRSNVQPRKRYFDNKMAASGEKELDLDQ
jgi:hypothetical protein